MNSRPCGPAFGRDGVVVDMGGRPIVPGAWPSTDLLMICFTFPRIILVMDIIKHHLNLIFRPRVPKPYFPARGLVKTGRGHV